MHRVRARPLEEQWWTSLQGRFSADGKCHPHRYTDPALTSCKKVIKEGEWLNITTVVTGRTRYSVFVDSQLVLADLDTRDYDDVPDFNAFFGNPTVGLGPWQDQAAFFRDLRLADADGKTFYVNKLDSEDVFAEFGVASNQYEWVPFSFYCRKSLLS